jgi:photosystem II stability/assembly factor-like uncharacterized protein
MKKRFALIVAVLTLVLSAVPDARGQWVQTALGNNYTASCLALSGSNLFAGGTKDSGVFLSTDAGNSWKNANNALTYTDVTSFAVNGTYLFAGTYSGYSDGIFHSTDTGSSWTEATSGLTAIDVEALIVSGTNLFAGTFVVNTWNTGGVFLSTDNGASWMIESNGLTGNALDIHAFAVMGENLFAGTADGVFLSTDNAESWAQASNGLTYSVVTALTVSGNNLFAGTFGGGICLSTDTGKSWTPASRGLTSGNIYSFAVYGDNIFTATDSGVFLSTDNGANWSSTGLTNSYVYALAVSDMYLFVGTLGYGVWRRPLSDFGISAVSPVALTENSPTSYPNPFSQSTTINFSSPESGVATVAIVNILGATVAHIFSGELDAGTHTFLWDKPTGLPAGVYECIVQMNGHVQRTAMVVN